VKPFRKALIVVPAVAVLALAQSQEPTATKEHEEHRSTTTQKTETTKTMSSSRQFNGRLVDAECDVLRSRWSPASSTSASTTAERRSTTSTEDQNTSAEGRPATDRTTTSTHEQSNRMETRSSADRTQHPALRAADLEACAVKSATTSYALATQDGNVYRLSGATLSDDISKNKNWSKKIENNNTKNMRVRVTGDLSGDTITVQSIK
jgi:hypothetical protein